MRISQRVSPWFIALALPAALWAAAPRGVDPGAQALLRGARVALVGGHYGQAISMFARLPSGPDRALGLGVALTRIGHVDQARPHLREAYAAYPLDPTLLSALRKVNDHEMTALEHRLHRLPKVSLAHREARERLLDLYELNGHDESARDLLLSDIPGTWRGKPTFADLERVLRLARLQSRIGRHDEAAVCYEVAARTSPDPRACRILAADQWIEAHAPEKAESILRTVRKEAAAEDVDLALAGLYFKTGRFAVAADLYELYPASLPARLGLGLCLVEMGDIETARPILFEMLDVFPSDGRLLDAVRVANEEEIATLRSLLNSTSLPPRSREEATDRLLTLYELSGRATEGRDLLLALARRHPLGQDRQLRLGRLFLADGLHMEAGRCFEAAATDTSRDALLAAVDAYLAAGSVGTAQHLLDRIHPVAPGQEWTVRMADVLRLGGHLEQARRLYERPPMSPRARLGLGLTLAKQGEFDLARPLLIEASLTNPTDPALLEALRALNDAEIECIEHERPLVPPGSEVAFEMFRRLLDLYELNGRFDEARELLVDTVPVPRMERDDLLRLARLCSLTGLFTRSGRYLEQAARRSPDPRAVLLLASDAYAAAGRLERVESILRGLAKGRPGPDIDGRLARMLVQAGRPNEGQAMARTLARPGLENPQASFDPRAARLAAVDILLDVFLTEEAAEALHALGGRGPGADLDVRRARLAALRGDHDEAASIYAKHPRDKALRLASGHQFLAAGRIDQAREVFRELRLENPEHREARTGYLLAREAGPYTVSVVPSMVDYGTLHSQRLLQSASLRGVFGPAVGTLSLTRTASVSLRPDDFDFQEDLYGAKLYWRTGPRTGLQLHGLTFSNNDPDSDGGLVLGMRASYFLGDRLGASLGIDSSKYSLGGVDQVSLGLGAKLNSRLRADALVARSEQHLGGNSDVITSTVFGRLSVTYQKSRRLTLVGSAIFGERQLVFDADDLFALNTRDTFRDGVSALASYQLNHRIRTVLRYAVNPFTLFVPADAPAGTVAADGTQTVTTLGVSYSL